MLPLEPLDEWPVPLRSRLVLLVAKIHGEWRQAYTPIDKQELIKAAAPSTEILVFWPGQWSSSARTARKRHLEGRL